jgi:hypothetical protein
VVVRRYRSGDFMLTFLDHAVAHRVLHAHPLVGTRVGLIFWRWRRQAGALFSPLRYKVSLSITNLFSPLRYKVLLSITNIYAHL